MQLPLGCGILYLEGRNNDMKNQIAQTILSQLGGNKFIAMTGSHSFTALENGLVFKIKKNKSQASALRVILNGNDTYSMEFLKVNLKVGVVFVKTLDDVYCDMLQDIFTETTGFYTSL